MNTFSDDFGKPSWLAPPGPREGLSRYVEVIRSRLRLIFACVVVVTVAAGAYATLAPRTWKAESHLLISPVDNQNNFVGLNVITAAGNPGGDISTAASLVTTPEVAALVAAKIGNTTGRALLKSVDAVPVAQQHRGHHCQCLKRCSCAGAGERVCASDGREPHPDLAPPAC